MKSKSSKLNTLPLDSVSAVIDTTYVDVWQRSYLGIVKYPYN